MAPTQACAVKDCKAKGDKVTFHKVPSSSKRLERWKKALKAVSDGELNENTLICGKHFKKSDYIASVTGTKTLLKSAVPSVFPSAMPKKQQEVVVRPRHQSRRAASKEALKQMQILLEDENDAVEIPDDDEMIPISLMVSPPKKKYKLTHRKSSDGNDREVLVLKSITPNITNHYVENNLELECWVEELEPCQKERNKKLQEEEKELQSKLDELIKACKGEVVYKGDLTTVIEVSEHVQKTIQAVKASVNKPPIVLNNTVANPPQGYQLVMDPRLGLIVGTLPTGNQSKQGKIQVATNLQAPVTPTSQASTPMSRRSRAKKQTTPTVQQAPPPPSPISTRSLPQTRSTPSTITTRSAPSPISTRSAPSPISTRSAPSAISTRSAPSPISTRSAPSPISTRSAPSPINTRSAPSPINTRSAPVPSPINTRSTPAPSPINTRSAPAPSPINTRSAPAPSPINTRSAPAPSPINTRSAPAPSPINTRSAPSPVNTRSAPSPIATRSGLNTQKQSNKRTAPQPPPAAPPATRSRREEPAPPLPTPPGTRSREPAPPPPTPPATRSRPSGAVVNARPTETSVEGGLTAGTTAKPKTVVDLTGDDGRPLPDSREISFNKLQGKNFPSLIVVARPHLRVQDVNADRAKLDAKVKSVLMYAPTKFTEWLIQQGLVKSEQKCSIHASTQLKLGMYSDVSKFPYSGGYVWISECCPQRFVSVFSGSVFEGSPHPPLVILKILYHWSCQTNIQNVTQWVKVDNLYVKGMYTWLRSICSVALQTHIRQLGGAQTKVEVGVISLGTTSQDGNSRQVKVEVLGILETTSKLIRLRAIEPLADGDRNYKKRFSKILEPLAQWVHPSSIIVTDMTVDKATLHQMGFSTVVQTTSVDANNSNRTIMEYLRRIVPRMFQNTLSLLSREIIQQFLDELVWREWFGTTSMQAFDNLIIHLAEQTRVVATESLIVKLNKVASNPFKTWAVPATAPSKTIPPPTTSAPPKPADSASKKRKRKEPEPPKPAPAPAPELNRPPKSNSPDVPEQMVPLENYYYGTIDNYPPKSNVTLNMKCPFCKETFNNNIVLMNHLFKHAHNVAQDGQMCRYCLTSVPTANDLLKHIATAHPSETKHENGFVCLICEAQYMNPFVLGKHMSKEHCPSELPYQCGTCGYRCSNHKQAIDHFYRQHDNGPTIQCPFCLKSTTVFSSSRNIAQNMHYFIQHLQKHQKKQYAKRCGKCNLWFVQKDAIKEHQTKMHASQRGKTGLIPWVAPRNGVMVPKSKMDKYPCDAEGINFTTLFFNISNNLKCKECDTAMDTSKHFPSFESCQNPNCQYSTCCSNAMQEHNAKCNKNSQANLQVEKLPYEMFCICGYSSHDGNQLARHLAVCERKSAYPSLADAKSASVTHSMLDVLGLVRKPEETEKKTERKTVKKIITKIESEPVTITLDEDDLPEIKEEQDTSTKKKTEVESKKKQLWKSSGKESVTESKKDNTEVRKDSAQIPETSKKLEDNNKNSDKILKKPDDTEKVIEIEKEIVAEQVIDLEKETETEQEINIEKETETEKATEATETGFEIEQQKIEKSIKERRDADVPLNEKPRSIESAEASNVEKEEHYLTATKDSEIQQQENAGTLEEIKDTNSSVTEELPPIESSNIEKEGQSLSQSQQPVKEESQLEETTNIEENNQDKVESETIEVDQSHAEVTGALSEKAAEDEHSETTETDNKADLSEDVELVPTDEGNSDVPIFDSVSSPTKKEENEIDKSQQENDDQMQNNKTDTPIILNEVTTQDDDNEISKEQEDDIHASVDGGDSTNDKFESVTDKDFEHDAPIGEDEDDPSDEQQSVANKEPEHDAPVSEEIREEPSDEFENVTSREPEHDTPLSEVEEEPSNQVTFDSVTDKEPEHDASASEVGIDAPGSEGIAEESNEFDSISDKDENVPHLPEGSSPTENLPSTAAGVYDDVSESSDNTASRYLEDPETALNSGESELAGSMEVEETENQGRALETMDYEDISNTGLDSLATMDTD